MLKKPLIFFILLSFVVSLFAQKFSSTVISSGGGSATKSSYSLAYTFGETFINTMKSQSNTLTEGFHQTYPKVIISGHNEVTATPNPVTSRNFYKLYLTFYFDDVKSYTVTIYNISGKNVAIFNYDNLLTGENKEIDFSSFALGIYLVKVKSKNGKIQRTFKIEKI